LKEKLIKLKDIQVLVSGNKIMWRNHILVRMQQRRIKIKDVIDCIMNGEIIEHYESDYPYPSCLILGFINESKGLHVVCAVGEEKVWMITTYYPNNEEWYDDLRTRRN
jgi:hypothetical protein